MTGPFKTERAAAQQRRIEDSLVELMGRRSYQSITVREICECAGLPRRTFYYYFEGKEDVLSALLERLLTECELETMFLPDIPRTEVERSFAALFAFWRDRARRELEALVSNGMEQELVNRCNKWMDTQEQWRQVIEQCDHQRRQVSSMLGITCVFYTLVLWCRHGFKESPEQLAAHVTAILTKPLWEAE